VPRRARSQQRRCQSTWRVVERPGRR
jgi:hypothetical protein